MYDEILAVSGSENPPTEADMKKMAFLGATVHEAARLLPTAPFLQRCSLDHGGFPTLSIKGLALM